MTDPTTGNPDQDRTVVAPKGRPPWPWAIATFLGVVAMAGVAAGYSIRRFGTIGHAIAYIKGIELAIDHRSKDLGACEAGRRVAVSFPLTNLSDRTVRIIGSRVDCSCIAADDRPFDIGPRETRSFDLAIEMPATPGPVERAVVLFSDIPAQRQIELTISGNVPSLAASASRDH